MTQRKTRTFTRICLYFSCAFGLLLGFTFSTGAQPTSQDIYLQCLTNFESYAESIWHPASYSGAPPDAGYWGDGHNGDGSGGVSANGGIRGNSGVALAYAVLCVAYPNDPKFAARLSRVRQALNYDAGTHFTGSYVCVDNKRWGWDTSSGDWQTPMWSASMGLACLLVESNLPAQTVLDCQRVVASEATHRAGIAPASGYISDTKAEENAWQGNILALAAAWMTNDPNASLWLTAAKKYLVNTYTVPDTNGDPLASWVTTQTLYPSYSLENHGFYHPTYEMVAGMSSGDSLLMARLANTNIAAELQPFAEHNVLTVWKTNLQYMVMDSGEFAYPAGLDWELHDYEQDSYIAWMAAHFNDPLARWTDGKLAQLVRYRQIINGDGEFVGPSGGGFYREAVEARRTAIAWLQWAHADYPTGPTNAPGPAVVQFPDVDIIAQRSPAGFVSVSYGSRIMGMVEAAAASIPTNAYVATPALPGVFGVGPLGNPTSASLVSFTTNAAGFTAELLVQNGGNGSTRVYLNSSGASVGIVEVPLPASGVTGTSAGCFTDGIENDPLTGGSRLLEWSGASNTVANFSNISTDINSPWICVSGRYGEAAGPGGYFHYQVASGYNRPGAAQDYLSIMPQTFLGPRYCVWFPNQNAAQTAASASQISWTTNGDTAVLEFPGPGGTTNVISALLATPTDGTWTSDADGNWSDPTNWAGGNIAGGTGSTADFTTLNITADRTVTLDSSRTVGILAFGDTSGTQGWTLNSSGGSILTLSAATPVIAVLQNTATINAPLAGTAGFTKYGPGTLILGGTNSLSGTLYLDIGSSSGTGDGAVRITSSAALANIAALSIRNNTGSANGSTLQLDGSSGSITVNQSLTASCRANTIPNIENLAGSNTFAGTIYMQVGGSNIVIQSDSGVLALNRTLQYVGSLTAGRWFNFTGSGNVVVNGPILYSSVAPISVGLWGSGKLTLNGANTYNGTTSVSGGTLAGDGVIAGPVTILPGGTLSPGDDVIGTLTINNTLTSSGVVLMKLQKSGSVLTNDEVVGLSTIQYGGTLQLMTEGDQLGAGDSFRLFSAANYEGGFANILPATPGVGLVWDTNNLAADGTLVVALGVIHPHVTEVQPAGTNLIWSGTGGAAASSFSVLSSTNLSTPVANWNVVRSGMFDDNGNFAVTSNVASGFSQEFYAIRVP